MDRLLRALGADVRDLADNGPVQVVSTGHSKVLVELRDRAVVDGLRPDPAALTALSREVGSNGFFVLTWATGEAHVRRCCFVGSADVSPRTGSGVRSPGRGR